MARKTDYLIIGSGIAGLTLAIKLAEKFPEKEITLVTKAGESESNTKYAQGGIAVVIDKLRDSFEKHIEDTIRVGAGLNKREVVEAVVREAPERLEELIEWGASFDRDKKGKLLLGMEGGHSEERIVHHKDITGFEMEQTLIHRIARLSNIKVFQHYFAIDLVTEHHAGHDVDSMDEIRCYGAYVLNRQTLEVELFLADYTTLATGGVGQVYQYTTNPEIATGDGIAMAYRARARIADMEFVQFHPTALYEPGVSPAFLISEAVRGAGAHLVHEDGERFMLRYDDRAELASRDIVARAIDQEMKLRGAKCVFLDCTHIPQDEFNNHFPNIREKCLSIGIDPAKDLIPVVPAAHYLCGGVVTDLEGRTSVKNLFASGECACTGLHGANRLASNSLLEGVVFSHHIFEMISKHPDAEPFDFDFPEWEEPAVKTPREQILINHSRNELRQMMSNYVGIVRSDERLKRASARLAILWRETEELYDRSEISVSLCELRNMIAVAHLIIDQSKARKENAGGFYKIESE